VTDFDVDSFLFRGQSCTRPASPKRKWPQEMWPIFAPCRRPPGMSRHPS